MEGLHTRAANGATTSFASRERESQQFRAQVVFECSSLAVV